MMAYWNPHKTIGNPLQTPNNKGIFQCSVDASLIRQSPLEECEFSKASENLALLKHLHPLEIRRNRYQK